MKTKLIIAALLIAATSFGQKNVNVTSKNQSGGITAANVTTNESAPELEKLKAEPVKKDTTIQLLMPLAQYRALLYKIDQEVDKKSATKEILDFLQRSAMIYQPAEEKKQATKPKQ